MKKYVYYVTNINDYIKISNNLDKNICFSIKNRLTKTNNPIFNIISKSDCLFCAFCGNHNSTWFPIYEINGRDITIVGVDYLRKGAFCYLSSKVHNCPGKGINGNSVEFIKAAYNLNETDAVNLLHSRNKSPFYRCNHDNEDSYIEYQSKTKANKTASELKQINDRANYNRSLDGYKSRFIDGEARWYATQKSKAISIDNLAKKYGDYDLAVSKYNKWKKEVKPSLENFIRRYGNDDGIIKYNQYLHRASIAHSTRIGRYSNKITITEKGEVLRSNFERAFYQSLSDSGILHDTEYYIDKPYPNSQSRFDFYFPEINMYIELAGLNDPIYLNKIQQKVEQFNCYVIYQRDKKRFHEICDHIKSLIKKVRNE